METTAHDYLERIQAQADLDTFVAQLRARYTDISREGYGYLDAITDLLEERGYKVLPIADQDPGF